MSLRDKRLFDLYLADKNRYYLDEDVKEAVLEFQKAIKETPLLNNGAKNNIINFHKEIFGNFKK